MSFQFCPYCNKKTPVRNFCVHCGNKLSNANTCLYCNASIPLNTTLCPFCGHNASFSSSNNTLKDYSHLNWISIDFRLAILVIFILSAYYLTQLMIGSIFFFFFPVEFSSDNNNAFFSLVIMLVSSILLILIFVKWLPFSTKEKNLKKSELQLLFLLIIILMVSVSIIEILVSLTGIGLDLINVDPSLSSPYDDFFINPLNILTFTILATIIGPIFEELVYRHFTISTMLKQCQSKFFVVFTSALIFSLSHTAANLLESLRYAILHLIVTFSIGIVLGIIFLRWGLKYAIIFHSLWNIFSLIVELLIIFDGQELIDLILLVSMAITFILTVFFLFLFRSSLVRIIFKTKLPTKTEILFILANFSIIITYELLLPLLLLSTNQNLLTAGLIFFYQFCGFLVGLILINRKQKIVTNFNSNLLEGNDIYEDLSSLE